MVEISFPRWIKLMILSDQSLDARLDLSSITILSSNVVFEYPQSQHSNCLRRSACFIRQNRRKLCVQAVACPFAVARKGVFHLEHLAHTLLLKGLQSQGPEKNVSTLQSITHLHRLLAFGEDVVIKTAGTSLPYTGDVHLLE